MRLLIDEHLSPRLVEWAATLGIYAQSVPHVGLAGASDPKLWLYAYEHEFIVVTTNARDFIELLDVEIHAGLILLREGGLSRAEQWHRRRPVLEHVLSMADVNYMINRLIDVRGVSDFEVVDAPKP